MRRPRSRPAPPRLALALVVAFGAAPAACNVFVSLDRCASDGDCPNGFVCEPGARFCALRADGGTADAADATTVDAPADVVDADVLDALADADASAQCDASAPFTSFALVAGVESRSISSARFTPDEKTMLFSALNGRCTEESCTDLYYATRPDLASPFVVKGELPGVSTDQASEYWPTITADGLLLFFESGRSLTRGVDGGYVTDKPRIWSSTRPNLSAQFSEPFIQSIFETANVEASPYLHPTGRTLYFMSNGRADNKGGFDLFVATLDQFGAASSITNLEALNTARSEYAPVVSPDDRVLYFAQEDPVLLRHIMRSTRPSPEGTFGPATLVGELATTSYEEFPSWISDDHCRLYFVSDRPSAADGGAGTFRLWVAERAP